MGNMSYCRFRNTVGDFSECLESIGNAGSLSEFSAGESGAARDLRELAERYVEWFDQLDEQTMLGEEQED